MGERMTKEEMNIGLALSGGGMRAAVFHLGILQYLASADLLQHVTHISSVSGASICIGLILGNHDGTWPDNDAFLNEVLPQIKVALTEKDVQWHALARLVIEPYYWDKKANLLANVMERKWNVKGCLQDITTMPRWTINTTAYETGKDFRIAQHAMGEAETGLVMNPELPISHAVAASAGFPVLIGPYKLHTKKYQWWDEEHQRVVPEDKVYHLWDGGVYDNMGLDPLFHIGYHSHFSKDINYLIVSNASGVIDHKTRRLDFSIENLKRLLDISMDQVESLRSTSVLSYVRQHKNGLYIKIGTKVSDILQQCELPYEKKEHYLQEALSNDMVKQVEDYPTNLSKMSKHDFELIKGHGYELARVQFEEQFAGIRTASDVCHTFRK